jgi:hypothetical protein
MTPEPCPTCKGRCCVTGGNLKIHHGGWNTFGRGGISYRHDCPDCEEGVVPPSTPVLTAEDNLVRVLRRVLDENKLREAHGEDTLGVLMKCGAFHDTEVAALAARIDAVEL